MAGLRLARGALLASLVGAGSVLGCASQQKKEAPIVRGLQFEGNHAVSSRQIEKKILTADTGWWPLATKQYFDPVSWEADLARIVRLYEALGYYQARIAHTTATPKPPDGVKLAVVIDEGQPTKIGRLALLGIEALPAADQAAVREKLPLVVGATFRESDWEAGKASVVARLRARGFATATVEGEAMVDVRTHEAALTLTARPGLRYRFAGIDVRTGPGARIPALFVWEQVRLAIPEGSTFSDAALE